MKLNKAVKFDIARLFNGAIDVDWLFSDPEKAERAAESFVFHGPAYHGVSQKDVIGTGHRLIDSASFFKNTLESLSESSDRPFTLAIAGFGSGKSHIALTLSELLETTNAALQADIIANIAQADERIAADIKARLPKLNQNVLVLTLNGMNNFDLSSQLLNAAKSKLAHAGLSLAPLEGLRERFTTAGKVLQNLDASLISPLLGELGIQEKAAVIERLSNFDETAYAKTHDFLSSLGIPLKAIGDETAKDVLKLLVANYVGNDKPFQKILLLFDEFGRYLEFATQNSAVAGNGALQHLYEGIQENSGKIAFVGFIQYELKAYEQRLPAAFKNELSRFITRFQSAEKLYLSINLETLIASLLVKDNDDILADEDSLAAAYEQIQKWYPSAANHSLWSTQGLFARVVGRGCWPLSPLCVWILFHLSAGGQYLQQRSALSLLKSALDANSDFELNHDTVSLPPVRLWSEDLQKEFEEVEEQAGRGAVMQSYISVMERSQQHLSDAEILLLRSIVLLSVTRLKAESRDDALTALRVFSGLPESDCASALHDLEDELNVVSWDDSFHQFDIVGDSVSKSQFLKFLRNKVDTDYDEEQAEKLFIKGAELASEYLKNIESDFGQEHGILTPEWHYASRFTYWRLFKQTASGLIASLMETSRFASVEEARGMIVYCYVPSYENMEEVLLESQKLLRVAAKDHQLPHLPVIISLIADGGDIGRILCELDAINNMSAQEQDMYGKMAALHAAKRKEAFKEQIRTALLGHCLATTFKTEDLPRRLAQLGTYIFEKIYAKVLPFPFDAFKSYRTNAAKDCMNFTRELLAKDSFTFDAVQTMPVQQRNRANTVLKTSWQIFNKDGSIAAMPAQASVRSIVKDWASLLDGNKELNCAKALEMACASPYGANIASAGLLFGVFVQARKNLITVIEDEESFDFATIIDSLFEGNVLSPKSLARITLYKNETTGSEWEQLLTDWSNADSYAQRVEFSEKARELRARQQIPQTLKWKFNELQRLADEAQCKIDEADDREDKGLGIIDRADQHQDVYNWSYGASLLMGCLKNKNQDPLWREEDKKPIADTIMETRQKIIQYFDGWIMAQRPIGASQAALAEFKTRLMDRCGKNLQNLELKEQYEKLEKVYLANARTIEAVGDAQQAIRNADEWMASNGCLVSGITVLQLETKEASLKEQIDLLRKPMANMTKLGRDDVLSDLEDRQNAYRTLLQKITDEKKRIDKKSKQVWDITVLEPETLDEVDALISELLAVHQGDERNYQDFQILANAFNSYRTIMQSLKSLDRSEDDFTAQVASAQSDYEARFEAFNPPWDIEQSFEALIRYCSNYRREASDKWLESLTAKVAGLNTMTTAEANDLNRSLSTPPPYINAKNEAEKLNGLKKQVETFLSTKEVEWLLEHFKGMSPDAQKEFIKAIQNMQDNKN